MTLREERNEQNKQAWRAHLEQERLDLSLSVEETLIDDGALAQHWQDELDEQDDSQPATGGTGIVPPRLSLQSVMLPAVQPERFIIATTDPHQIASSHVEEEAEQKSSGMLARLARRFTSSFAAVKPEVPQQQAAVSPSEKSFPQDMEAYRSTPASGQFPAPTDSFDAPLVQVIDTTSSFAPSVEMPPSQPQHKKRRSLKRNGKVRLETTEQPALSKASLFPRVEDQETGEELLAADVRDALSRHQAPSTIPEQSNSTTGNALSTAIQRSISGSGAFKSEQGEVMVANSYITAASVVLVTLTTNPGPVVVQYISLQPEVGFTVHLTAPVATHTTFNYVIVQADTF